METNEQPIASERPKRSSSLYIIIGIIVLVVVGAGVGGFFILKKGKEVATSVGTGAIEKALNANCKYDDKDLCKHLNNLKVSKDMSGTSTSTDKDGNKFESTWEMQGEDRSHFVVRDNGKETMNMIAIGDTNYSKDYTDNQWWKKTDKKEKDQLLGTIKPDYEENFEDLKPEEDKTTYKKIGKESFGKLQCFKYQVLDPANTDTTEYIWFDDKEYLLRKSRSESKDGSIAEQTYSYDKISIKEPSPTKEAKSDMDMFNIGTVPQVDTQQLEQEIQNQMNNAITPPVDQGTVEPNYDTGYEVPTESTE